MLPDSAPVIALVIQCVALAVSGIGITGTIVWNVRVNRRRATVEMLLAEQTNELLLEYRSKYLSAVKNGDIERLAQAGIYYYDPESFYLVSTMNRCDLVAIGISEGIIDRRIYKRYWRSSYVQDWIRCKKAVEIRRRVRDDPTLFEDFERLACQWANPKERALIQLI